MNNRFMIVGILGALAVALGAYGAHGLERIVSPDRLEIYQTGSRYHFYHMPLLLVLAWASSQRVGRSKLIDWSWRLTLVGLLLFCGSLYTLAFRDMLSVDIGILGAITPLGGLSLIAAWLLMGFGMSKA